VASAYKAPSLYQLDSEYGFAGLQPQTTKSYEAGLNLVIIRKILSFNTAFYKYNTSNVIYFKNIATAPFNIYANGEHQSNKGFENELKLTMDKLTANAYWAYVTGKLTDENGVTTNYLLRQPKNTAGLDINYDFTTKFSAGLNYKYTGDRPDEQFAPVTYAQEIVNLKHYNLLDAHLQYTANKHVSLFADLNNLLDVKYTDWAGYNTMRFNFMAGLKVQIN
jgi:vitamin B12 transporter